MSKYSIVAGGPPLKTGEMIRVGLDAEEALAALGEVKSSQGPAYVCDEEGGIVGPRELERRIKGKVPKSF